MRSFVYVNRVRMPYPTTISENGQHAQVCFPPAADIVPRGVDEPLSVPQTGAHRKRDDQVAVWLHMESDVFCLTVATDTHSAKFSIV